jgi:hypothetical protein
MLLTLLSTSPAWPFTRTSSQISSILPSAPIRKVLRTIPLKILPMNFFGRHTPYASIILWVGSPSSEKFSFCFCLKLASAFSASALAPRIATFCLSKCFFASRNSDASVVQPGVLALGKKNNTTRFPLKSPSDTSAPVSLLSVKSGAWFPIFSMTCILNLPATFSIFHSRPGD